MLWCCGVVVLWCCGVVVLWCCGAVVLWCCGAAVPSCSGAAVQRCSVEWWSCSRMTTSWWWAWQTGCCRHSAGARHSRLRAGRRGRAESARPHRWVTTQQAEGGKEGTRRVRSAAQVGHNAAGGGQEGGDAQSPLGRTGGSQRSRLRAGRRGRAESARPRRWVTTQQAEGRKEGARRVRSAAQVGHNAAG